MISFNRLIKPIVYSSIIRIFSLFFFLFLYSSHRHSPSGTHPQRLGGSHHSQLLSSSQESLESFSWHVGTAVVLGAETDFENVIFTLSKWLIPVPEVGGLQVSEIGRHSSSPAIQVPSLGADSHGHHSQPSSSSQEALDLLSRHEGSEVVLEAETDKISVPRIIQK